VQDKLLNLVQLRKIDDKNSLLLASIDQRSDQIKVVHFEEVISFKENLKYIKYLIFPFLAIAILGIVSPNTITEPTKRIIQFNKKFIPAAPFQFSIQNENLMAFRNEDFLLDLKLTGEEIPESAYLITDSRKIKLQKTDQRSFEYNFEKIQESALFSFEAAGYTSGEYTIDVVNRPNIKNFVISLTYPAYLKKQADNLENIGSFQVPNGTKAKWIFNTSHVEEIELKFANSDKLSKSQSIDNQIFEYNATLFNSDEYSINLKNNYSQNKETIRYNIEVIPDEFPKINLDQLRDTVLYQYLIFGGNISDDYGISDLILYYRTKKNETVSDAPFTHVNLNVDKTKNNQSFYHHWKLNEFKLKNGEKIEYYLQVRDNDAINGRKVTRTAHYTFEIPSIEELRNELKLSSESADNQLDNTIKDAKELNKDLEDIND
jgi:hypothetical protein